MTGTEELHDAIVAGDRRSIGRAISAVERGDPAIEPVLRALYLTGGRARTIGVTGPPGAGKSTLVDKLALMLRARGEKVAVLAVDPSSPLSGGAVLGDRVRMAALAGDEAVLIRSMAARGALGGLAEATADAVTILDGAGFDTVLIETVGVGQSEVEIAALADTVILLQTAHGGDGVQTVKAGVLEMADIVVVNKAEAPGSRRMASALAQMLAHRVPTLAGWDAPVIETEATAGAGLEKLLAAIDDLFAALAAAPAEKARRSEGRVRARIAALVDQSLRRKLFDARGNIVEKAIADVAARRADPHATAAEIARRLIGGMNPDTAGHG